MPRRPPSRRTRRARGARTLAGHQKLDPVSERPVVKIVERVARAAARELNRELEAGLLRGVRLRGRDVVLTQNVAGVHEGERTELERDAATLKRPEHTGSSGRQQDEEHARPRLLDGLEEGVGGLVPKPVCWVDDGDVGGGLKRRVTALEREVPRLVHLDLRARCVGRERDYIGVRPLEHAAADVADTAPQMRDLGAYQRAGEAAR